MEFLEFSERCEQACMILANKTTDRSSVGWVIRYRHGIPWRRAMKGRCKQLYAAYRNEMLNSLERAIEITPGLDWMTHEF